jgi:hypothetical protein
LATCGGLPELPEVGVLLYLFLILIALDVLVFGNDTTFVTPAFPSP